MVKAESIGRAHEKPGLDLDREHCCNDLSCNPEIKPRRFHGYGHLDQLWWRLCQIVRKDRTIPSHDRYYLDIGDPKSSHWRFPDGQVMLIDRLE